MKMVFGAFARLYLRSELLHFSKAIRIQLDEGVFKGAISVRKFVGKFKMMKLCLCVFSCTCKRVHI